MDMMFLLLTITKTFLECFSFIIFLNLMLTQIRTVLQCLNFGILPNKAIVPKDQGVSHIYPTKTVLQCFLQFWNLA
jgi:hypothetical protein